MKTALTILVSVIMAVLVIKVGGFTSSGPTVAQAEDAYDRVMRTKTIRCGYALWPPYVLSKDPNTKKLSGFAYDIVEEMGKRINLKIDWVEEVAWGPTVGAGLWANRYDMFCTTMWGLSYQAPKFTFSVPIVYSGVHFYAHVGDHRFDKDLSILNNPQYKLSTMDGENSAVVARTFFPKASTVSLPAGSDLTSLTLNVATGKADGVFLEPSIALDFATHNPGKIRQVTTEPYQVFATMLAAKLGEHRLIDMVNVALAEMQNTGVTQRIISEHVPKKGIFMSPIKPYTFETPEALP